MPLEVKISNHELLELCVVSLQLYSFHHNVSELSPRAMHN